jgi:hypothetical protein
LALDMVGYSRLVGLVEADEAAVADHVERQEGGEPASVHRGRLPGRDDNMERARVAAVGGLTEW